jgi:hypothetical protein
LLAIEAAKKLGWTDIPATVIDVDLLSAERDENSERKDFTPSELVAIGQLIEEQQRPAALERKRLGALNRHGKLDGVDIGASIAQPRTTVTVARAVGMGAGKYKQAKAVVAAAEIDPNVFGDLPAKMDETMRPTMWPAHIERWSGAAAQRPGTAASHAIQFSNLALENLSLGISCGELQAIPGWLSSRRSGCRGAQRLQTCRHTLASS